MNKKKKLLDAVFESAVTARDTAGHKQLTCAQAFALAKRFNVETIEIGRICNENNIKVCKCQLGCFK
ncbi:MAG: hypothetical protein JSW66_01185 [Phycisphaerales bacterium]|nr:MAG: hypothetical protein JSW66_01185 [Phycisphaerales bacterium]